MVLATWLKREQQFRAPPQPTAPAEIKKPEKEDVDSSVGGKVSL